MSGGLESVRLHHRRAETGGELAVDGLRFSERSGLLLELAHLRQLAGGFEVDDQRRHRQVVEKGWQAGVEVGGEELEAGESGAGSEAAEVVVPVRADVGPETAQASLLAHHFGRQLAARGTDHKLAAGPDGDPRDWHDRSLVLGVEQAQALDLVAEELGADRGAPGGREDVEDASSDRELASLLDQRFAAVAEVGETGRELVQVRAAAGLQLDRGHGEQGGRDGWAHRGPPRGDHQRWFVAGQRGQRLETAADRRIHGRRAGEEGDRHLGEQVGGRGAGQPWPQLGQEAFGVPDQHERRHPVRRGLARERSRRQGPGARRQPGE